MPFVENLGAKIFWDSFGSGEPLLLIMGLGYPSTMWYRSLPELSAAYRVILFDNRGAGKSDVPPGPYPMATMASDALAVLHAAGERSAHVFGASLGGMIAQEFTLQYPSAVRSLILGCTFCGGTEAVQAAPEVLAMLVNRGSLTEDELLEVVVPIVYAPQTPRARIEEDFEVRRKSPTDPAGYMAQLQGIMAWGSYSRLGQIGVPTLIVHGDCDRLVPPQNAQILHKAIKGSELVIIHNASHIMMTDQGEAFSSAIMPFLAKQSRAHSPVVSS
jgi:3-oxoadipate enol-lactonase